MVWSCTFDYSFWINAAEGILMFASLSLLHFGLATVAVLSGAISVSGQVRGQTDRRWTMAFLLFATAAAACGFVPFEGFTFAAGLGIVILLAVGVVLVARWREAFGDWQIVEITGSALAIFLLAVGLLATIPSLEPFLRDKDLWMSLGTGLILMLLQLFFIDLLIRRHEQRRLMSTWAAANREFLAACVLIGWSVARATSYYLRRGEDNGLLPAAERRLLLRDGLENALFQVVHRSQAFDPALQIAEAGFEDEARARLATVAFWIRSAGTEAAAALMRFQRIAHELPAFSEVPLDALPKHQVRGAGVPIPSEMGKRDRALLVYHLGELVDFAATACRDLRDFVLLRDTADGLSTSELYRAVRRKFPKASAGSDLEKIDVLAAQLTEMHARILANGICLVLTDEVDDDVEKREYGERPT